MLKVRGNVLSKILAREDTTNRLGKAEMKQRLVEKVKQVHASELKINSVKFRPPNSGNTDKEAVLMVASNPEFQSLGLNSGEVEINQAIET
jgi:hypothetical protein